jgi:toxin ParE1/3/4
MRFKVTIVPDAMDDMRLAAKWYNKQKKGLGNEFVARVKECEDVLKINPYFFKRYKQIHTLPLKQFPFLIHFSINESAKKVTILAILHTSMYPKTKWV